jgi:hypothetical protein
MIFEGFPDGSVEDEFSSEGNEGGVLATNGSSKRISAASDGGCALEADTTDRFGFPS